MHFFLIFWVKKKKLSVWQWIQRSRYFFFRCVKERQKVNGTHELFNNIHRKTGSASPFDLLFVLDLLSFPLFLFLSQRYFYHCWPSRQSGPEEEKPLQSFRGLDTLNKFSASTWGETSSQSWPRSNETMKLVNMRAVILSSGMVLLSNSCQWRNHLWFSAGSGYFFFVWGWGWWIMFFF